MKNPPALLAFNLGLGLLLFASAGCTKSKPAADEWLTGDTPAKFTTVAKHLRGNDVVMWEVEHRFRSLWEQGQLGNWDYAAYQLTMMERTMRLGYERRPARRASYDVFFQQALPPLQQAVQAREPAAFAAQMQVTTQLCMACHATEKVPFIPVLLPAAPRPPHSPSA